MKPAKYPVAISPEVSPGGAFECPQQEAELLMFYHNKAKGSATGGFVPHNSAVVLVQLLQFSTT